MAKVPHKKPLAVLLGDDIKIGYQDYVKKELHGIANIWTPEINCQGTEHILTHIESWLQDIDADLIHLNAGHFDLGRINNINQTPLDRYALNIEQIIKLLHKIKPQASIVWASTTPVHDVYSAKKTSKIQYFNEDVIRYNATAFQVAERMGIGLNDLYTLTMESGGPNLLDENGRDFRDNGNRHLAQWVAYTIKLFAGL